MRGTAPLEPTDGGFDLEEARRMQEQRRKAAELAAVEVAAAAAAVSEARERLRLQEQRRRSSPAGKQLLEAATGAEDALKLARALLPELEPEPEPEPLRQPTEQLDLCQPHELPLHERWKDQPREQLLEPMPRICQFGDCGRGISLLGEPGVPKRSAKCKCGPSCVVSQQSSVDHVLAWTVGICAEAIRPVISIGAVPDNFVMDLNRDPTEPHWIVSSVAGAAPGTHLIQVNAGDRFAVVADLHRSRLTIHQQSKPAGLAPSSTEWKTVLDTFTLRGAVRLCVCLYGDVEVELLKMRWSGTGDALQRRYEAALAALEPALGAADPTVLSTQHNLANIYMNLARTETAELGVPPPLLVKAERMMGLALAGRRIVLGEEHMHTRKSAHCLQRIQRRSWAAQLEAIYSVYNPRKVRDIETLLDEYAGREVQLLQAVKQKYGVRTAAELRLQEEAAKKAAGDKEISVLADRFLGEISRRNKAAAAANQKKETLAFERAAEEAALLATERLEKLALRRRQKALREEVEAGRPSIEERKQARTALVAASALITQHPSDQVQLNSPDRQQGQRHQGFRGFAGFTQVPPPPVPNNGAISQQGSSFFPQLQPVVTSEQAAAVAHMREWALEVERHAPRVHGSRTMYM